MRVAIDANTILSGLFFSGNERRLLLESLKGNLTLIFAEDVIEEVYEVVQETFGEHPNLATAFELLETVFGAGQLVRNEEYRKVVAAWAHRLRDPSDAPVVACATVTKVDYIVTGDKDLLELGEAEGIKVLRTKRLLADLKIEG